MMARPRANAATPRSNPRAIPRSPFGPVASTTGAVGGSGLVAFAQTIPGIFGKILVFCAPAISIAVARFGPDILDFAALVIRYSLETVRHGYSMHRIRAYLNRLRARIDDPNLTPERRSLIERRIKQAEDQIEDQEYRRVMPFYLGDTTVGLRETRGDEGGDVEGTNPPTSHRATP